MTAADSFTVRIGGEAGQGTATTAGILAEVFLKLGYHVFSSKEYASQIQGGHNYHNVRVSIKPVKAETEKIDYLLAFDELTLIKHQEKIVSGGAIFHPAKLNPPKKSKDISFISIPEKSLTLSGKNMLNAVFIGAAVKALGIELKLVQEVIQHKFQSKAALQLVFLEAVKKGYESSRLVKKILPLLGRKEKAKSVLTFLSGNEAIVKGALKAGLTFHAQYPMTPVSGILHYLAKEAALNQNLTVIQPEDEIAVINMALGASYAGARAMVATSGGGFALMVEALGLAGMAEIPLVIIEGQRSGPATGLPTKTEQGDLLFVLSAAPGDFPRIVIAPASAEESYTETKRAFYLAEKYQVPAIILTDKHLSESFHTIDLEKEEKNFRFDYSKRISLLSAVKESDLNPDGLFKRYHGNNFQRPLPGTKNGIYTCAGDEHDEVGYITEDQEIREQMMQRRMQKLELIAKEMPPPELIGPKTAGITVICWGSNQNAVLEAINKINFTQKLNSKKINCLAIKSLCPFLTEKVKSLLSESNHLVLIENNYTGQLGQLITQKTGIIIQDKILRYDGLAFTVEEVYEYLQKRLNSIKKKK